MAEAYCCVCCGEGQGVVDGDWLVCCASEVEVIGYTLGDGKTKKASR